jgi:hypothetical protein
MDQPLILHSHIPKTAGVTVSRILHGSFDLFHLHHYHPDPNFLLTPDVLEKILEISPALKSISSHCIRTFPQRVGGRPVFYITFLRNPADVFVSLLRYVKQEFANLSPEALALWPEDTPRLDLKSLAARKLEEWGDRSHYCPISHFFCGPHIIEKAGKVDEDSYDNVCQELTKLILSRFFFVGLVEEMPRSIRLLKAKLARYGLRLKPPLMQRFNKTKGFENLSWLKESNPLGARVLKATAFDRVLYDHFYHRFREEYRRFENGETVSPPEELPGFQLIEDWAVSVCLDQRPRS